MGKPKKRTLEDYSVAGPSQSKKRLTQTDQQNVISISQSSQINSGCGKLMKLHLINFMCHENLVINFNDRVNFIIGRNGSGKSAILTAVVIALGANAKATSRSSSIKELVKTGKSSATIELELSNFGLAAYKNDLYGNKIKIIRTIHINGSSTYNIKNEYGKTIEKKAEELRKILFHFNIQPDNPIFVLHQDNARQFLRDLDPKKNYTLFMRATQIQTIIDKFSDCVNLCKNFSHKHKLNEEENQILAEEVKELQSRYNFLLSTDDMKLQLHQYKLELSWKKVAKQEEIVNDIKKEVQKLLNNLQHYKFLLANKAVMENTYKENMGLIEVELTKLNDKLEEENQILQKLERKVLENAEKLKFEQEKYEILHKKSAQYKQNIASVINSIQKNSQISQGHIDRLRQEHKEKEARYKKQKEDLLAMIASTKREIQRWIDSRKQYEEQFEDLKHNRQQVVITIENIGNRLKSINTSKNDRLSIYGQHINRLLKLIEQAYKAGKFSEMPKGPVGRYIEVYEDKWRGAVEYLLKSCINLFLVNSKEDRKVLDQIIKSEFPNVQLKVVTNKFLNKVYDVQKGMAQPPKGFTLLMHAIKCSDPVVMNCLIDRARVETILLVENQDLAVKHTSYRENIPRNLQKVILLNPLTEYYPLPLLRTYSLEVNPPRYLQTNVEDTISQLKSKIQSNQERKQQIENQLIQIKVDLENTCKQEQDMKLILTNHEKSIYKVDNALDELKDVEFPSENENDDLLQSELTEMRSELEKTLKNLKEQKQLCDKLIHEKQNIERDLNQKQQLLISLQNEIKLTRAKQDKCKLDYNRKLFDFQNNENKKCKISSELKLVERRLETEIPELHYLKLDAQLKGERVDSETSEEDILDLIKSLEAKIRQILSSNENMEDVKKLLDDKFVKLKKNSKILKDLEETTKMMKHIRKQRFEHLAKLKEHMSIRLKHEFDRLLRMRDFSGELNIDHGSRELKISVIPRDINIENSVSNTKSLSGGERSFTTIAFLLSLWSCIEHPFYMLDEYDVFADQCNREIMTNLLLAEAKHNPHLQYIFLTPQNMSFLKLSDFIKVYQLSKDD